MILHEVCTTHEKNSVKRIEWSKRNTIRCARVNKIGLWLLSLAERCVRRKRFAIIVHYISGYQGIFQVNDSRQVWQVAPSSWNHVFSRSIPSVSSPSNAGHRKDIVIIPRYRFFFSFSQNPMHKNTRFYFMSRRI